MKNTNGGTTTYKTVTGAAVNDWASDYGDTITKVLYKTVNGVTYIYAALITEGSGTVPAATGEVDNYGYILSAPYAIEEGEDDDAYLVYDLWNGTEKVTVKDETTGTNLAKGDVIKYTDLGNGYIKDVTETNITAVAITGYNDKTLTAVKSDGTPIVDTAIDSDTVILYVDSEKFEGVAGGEFALAAQQANGSRIMNAWVLETNSDGNVDPLKLVVYEINNDIDTLANDNVGTIGAAGFTIPSLTATNITNAQASKITNNPSAAYATGAPTYAIDGDEVTVEVKSNASTATVIAVDGVDFKLTTTGNSTGVTETVAAATYAKGSVMCTLKIAVVSTDVAVTVVAANHP